MLVGDRNGGEIEWLNWLAHIDEQDFFTRRILALPSNYEEFGVGEKPVSPWEADGSNILKELPGFWWERGDRNVQ